MIITFNELRRIKDRLPSGSSQRIADELGIDVDTVRNYFGGKHESKECVGVHFEPGPKVYALLRPKSQTWYLLHKYSLQSCRL